MNWEQQWELFSPQFKEGKSHIDLAPYGTSTTLQLYPGPGFGDLSHPTTRLVLQLMQPYLNHHPTIDIGCGSGILSFAAAAMGAHSVYGYDIDPEAVLHAQRNLELSPHRNCIVFSTQPPLNIPPGSLLLMNMISSEQTLAWDALQLLHPVTLITSGILTKDAPAYIAQKQTQNCKLLQALTEGEWSGFVLELQQNV